MSESAAGGRIRIASVSFLNSRPLIYGLDQDPKVQLELAVPSRLSDSLRNGSADVALLPVIDYQRLPGLKIVPAGGIGCDGTTLTVRIFAQRPIETIRTLACDSDSHTSVALARIILAEKHGTRPEFVELSKAAGRPDEARLLIGDKVVCEEPPGFEYQYDLGAEWKQLTGLPFVFAVWTAREGVELGDLSERLEKAKRSGLEHVRELIDRYAVPRGWPAGLALQYLTMYLKFDIGEMQMRAIEKFHELAHRHGMIGAPRPLKLSC
ncbi:MAG TPA: menaquinone biosynthesis protein [Tepidisphaeraceae bacterium]